MNVQLAAAGAFLTYLVLAWVSAKLILPDGPIFYIVGGLLSAVGISVFGIWYWWNEKREAKKAAAEAAGGADAPAAAEGADAEIDGLIREAETKIAQSKIAPKIGALPAVFLIGDPGSTKTTVMANSGLEPELLAGHVYQDANIIPTRGANLWLTRNTIFVDASGAALADTNKWTRLIRRLAPGKIKAVTGGDNAPRAAIVCFDAESFMRQGAQDSVVVAARNLHAKLGAISEQLGISFPVYVLFTRADRLPFFLDFVRNLSVDEARQVFGVTVPIRQATAGVYNQEETTRLSQYFGSLVSSLADKRIIYLPRENDASKLGGEYEFPREFRKLRAPLVQFLVELCKPSQLRASPFLRGFYFCGVRPVIVQDSAPVMQQPQQPQQQYGLQSGATQVFKSPGFQQPQQPMAMPQGSGTRKVPQWVFLTRVFNDVILADKDGMAASGSSAKTSTARRILFATLGILGLIASGIFTMSYFGNRSLENKAVEAAQAIKTVAADPNGPSIETLKKLDSLRESLETLSRYEHKGSPYRLRWGLYTGSDLYPEVCRLYYKRLDTLLLNDTKANMLKTLQTLPSQPSPTDQYAPVYETLKAYLVVTDHHDKSTRDFLSPTLFARWANGRQIDGDRQTLIVRQFDFFAGELPETDCYKAKSDAGAIDLARDYLTKFGGVEPIYRYMLSEAARKNPPVNFNKMFAKSDEIIVNNRDVSGAFTKKGWDTMQDSVKRAKDFFAGEQWVTGRKTTVSDADLAKIQKDIQDLYTGDFIAAWRQYLKNSKFQEYKDLTDAAKKLNIMVQSDSPLMALYWLAANNTAVDSQRVKDALLPIHSVVPPPAQNPPVLILPTNEQYIGALRNLQASVEAAVGKLSEPAVVQNTIMQANAAHQSAGIISGRFGMDMEAQLHLTSRNIIEAPITSVDLLVKGAGKAELNKSAGGLCNQFGGVMRKFPFNSKSIDEASIDDINKLFRPNEGEIWKFYQNGPIKKYLKEEGGRFVADTSDPTVTLNPRFVAFFNAAASFSRTAYAKSADPVVTYTLGFVKTDKVESLTIVIDGQTATLTASAPTKSFTWPGGGARGTKPTINIEGGSQFPYGDFPGLWSIFRFFREATPGGNNYTWPLKAGPREVGNLRLNTDFPFFRREFLDGLGCVSVAAN